MFHSRRTLILVGLVVVVGMLTGGCAYMKDRGNDALDIFDIGVTFTKTPHVGVYAGFQSLLSLGYANIDGYMFGIGQRHVGWMPMRYHAAGALLEGYEQFGFAGNFDPDDPESPYIRGAGLGLIYDAFPRTVPQFMQCPKFVHLGWIGLNLNCKLGAIGQFLLGWTTLDMGHSDGTFSKRAVDAPITVEDPDPTLTVRAPAK